MAEVTRKVVEIPVTVVEKKSVVVLTLSEEEAETLYHVSRRIGGSGRRRHMNTIEKALSDLGYPEDCRDIDNDRNRSIYFKINHDQH